MNLTGLLVAMAQDNQLFEKEEEENAGEHCD